MVRLELYEETDTSRKKIVMVWSAQEAAEVMNIKTVKK
jgi:hypothetical protein